MNRKRILLASVLVMAGAGLGLATIPFGRAMLPSAKATSAQPHIDISGLGPGSYRMTDLYDIRSSDSGKVLVLRDFDGSLHAFFISVSQDRYGIFVPPNTVYFYCSDFGPDVDGDRLRQGGIITCHDYASSAEDFPRKDDMRNARWTYAGKSIGAYPAANLAYWDFHLEQNYLVLDRLHWGQ